MENTEKIITSNSFGSVSSQRIIFNNNGYFEELSMKQVYSVSMRRKNNIIAAIVYFMLSLIVFLAVFKVESAAALFEYIPRGIIIIAIITFTFLFLVSMFHYIGHHTIRINDVGNDRRKIKVKLWKTKDGREFTEAIKQQLHYQN